MAARIPRTIWFLWFQGLDEAPDLVHRCLRSWVDRNPTWRVTFLDKATLPGYSIVDYPAMTRLGVCPQHIADLLRLDLLARHGGVWADATTFCVKPLDDWLPESAESGFFAFCRPGPDRLISNWFLAAEPGNVLVSRLYDFMNEYWTRHRIKVHHWDVSGRLLYRFLSVSPRTRAWWFSPVMRDWLAVGPYFAMHYGFELLTRRDPECGRVWERTSKISADGPHRLQFMGLLRPATHDLKAQIDSGDSPLYKTDWRVGSREIPPNSVLAYLLARHEP